METKQLWYIDGHRSNVTMRALKGHGSRFSKFSATHPLPSSGRSSPTAYSCAGYEKLCVCSMHPLRLKLKPRIPIISNLPIVVCICMQGILLLAGF